ncbi:MAG: S8 family serine peptidase [Pseudomonadota bacterium]
MGGFASALPTARSGDRFQSTADGTDYYRVTLAGSEVITLSISDHLGGSSTTLDFDLGLFDSSGQTLIDFSVGQGPTETVTTLTAGTYIVLVEAYAGNSNYTLSIGQPTTPAAAPLNTNAEFVPGEIIVRFKETAKTASGGNSLIARAASVGLTPLSGNAGRPMLMRHESGAQRAQALRMLGISDKNRDGTLARMVASKRDTHRADTIRAVQALRARADVAEADLNYIHRPLLVPNDVMYSRQWHYPLIRLPQAWDITTGTPATGQVIVAVIDTGVVLSHPDLAGQLIQGYDFISNLTNARDGNGIDPNADDPGDGIIPGSSSFHGTHVAGTVAASTNNGMGVAGVSWGARIMPLRVLGAQGGTSYDIIQAVRYAAGLPNDSGTLPVQRADIINLSLAGGAFSQSEQNVYTAARNQGVIIIIAAAGNENTSRLSYPASYDGVVSVSAVGLNSAKAPYSNIGTAIDVAAPGGDASSDLNGDGYPDGILSTLATDASSAIATTYQYYQGTSMAAPHIAGVVALMKAVHPGLTPSQLDIVLAGGAISQDRGDRGRDDIFGHGLIDALKAVQRAQALAGGSPPPSVLTVTPTALNFGFTARTPQTLTAANGGGGTLGNVTATDNAAWLTITGSGLGPYSISVNDSGLGAGVYSAKITFTSSANIVTVPVTVQVGTAGTGNAGFHYIMLIDPATGNTAYQDTAASGGTYNYSIGSVAVGGYYVVAGSDLDNDGFICDPGEACGAYPTIDLPAILNVGTSNLTGIDFATGFVPAIGVQSTQVPSQRGYARTLAKRVAQ